MTKDNNYGRIVRRPNLKRRRSKLFLYLFSNCCVVFLICTDPMMRCRNATSSPTFDPALAFIDPGNTPLTVTKVAHNKLFVHYGWPGVKGGFIRPDFSLATVQNPSPTTTYSIDFLADNHHKGTNLFFDRLPAVVSLYPRDRAVAKMEEFSAAADRGAV